MDWDLLDENDLLTGDVLLLEKPFQLPHTSQGIGGLQGIDDQENMMIGDRNIGPFRKP